MKKVTLALILLGIVLLGILVGPGLVRTTTAAEVERTYCWCVYRGAGLWCYRCCDMVSGCYDLYCDSSCP